MQIRRAELPADRFTQISNAWLRDKRLSWKARGLLGWLASHHVDFRITEQAIVNAAPDGRDSVRSALRELIAAGYLLREQTRDADGKLAGTSYVLLDPWAAKPQVGAADGKSVDGATSADANPQVTTVDGETGAGKTVDGKPVDGPTSTNKANGQVGTVDGKTVDGKSAPIRRLREKNTKKNTRKTPGPLAAGEVARRNARATATAPPAAAKQEFDQLAGEVLAGFPEHYRRAAAWLRKRLIRKIAAALEAGHQPIALVTYAHRFADDPTRGEYEHLRAVDDVVRRLVADVADGTACPDCGHDPKHVVGFCAALAREA